MKTLKTALALLLALCMVLSLGGVTALADNGENIVAWDQDREVRTDLGDISVSSDYTVGVYVAANDKSDVTVGTGTVSTTGESSNGVYVVAYDESAVTVGDRGCQHHGGRL